jgi:septation ring formation regulator EzrA
MNRASDRETRLVAVEERLHEVLQHLENLTVQQQDMARKVDQLQETQAYVARSILKLNREIGAQREKYPV